MKRRRRLADGSWLVSVAVKDPSTRKKIGSLILREIHATMHVEGEATPRPIRLWTSLLDPEEHPALALVELYTKRWEEELFFRELKTHVHGADSLLHAQTVESAAMEVMALLLAAAVLAGNPDASSLVPEPAAEVQIKRMKQLAKDTIIPSIKFSNLSTAEAWTRLGQLASTSGAAGFHMIVREPSPESVVNLDLRQIPLSEAIRLLGLVCGTQVAWQPWGAGIYSNHSLASVGPP